MTLSDSALESHIAGELRSAGFPVVQLSPSRPSLGHRRRLRVDLLAWDFDEEGQLRPAFVVEARTGLQTMIETEPEKAQGFFRQLAAYANAFGTSDAYLADGNGWWRMSDAFDAAEPSAPPQPSGFEASGPVNEELVAQLLSNATLEFSDAFRSRGRDARPTSIVSTLLDAIEGKSDDVSLPPLLRGKESGPVVLNALFGWVLPRFDGRRAPVTTPWALVQAMARLARPTRGSVVRDPFCGLGACLWAAASQEGSLTLRGSETNKALGSLAVRLGALAGYEVSIDNEHALLQEADFAADTIVSCPPMGEKFPDPLHLESGGRTRHGEEAALEKVYHWLRPGGRAVLLLPPFLLSRGGSAERVRRFLQSRVSITALVGLPPGVLAPNSLAPVIVVIDKDAPGETLVARLGDDWEDQLASSGEFFKAFLNHAGGGSA